MPLKRFKKKEKKNIHVICVYNASRRQSLVPESWDPKWQFSPSPRMAEFDHLFCPSSYSSSLSSSLRIHSNSPCFASAAAPSQPCKHIQSIAHATTTLLEQTLTLPFLFFTVCSWFFLASFRSAVARQVSHSEHESPSTASASSLKEPSLSVLSLTNINLNCHSMLSAPPT